MTEFFQDGDALAAIDLETTGLTAHDNRVLEVACIVVDPFLLESLSDEPFHAVVRYHPAEVATMYAVADPYVQKMHMKTGLWAKLTEADAMPLEAVDKALREYIAKHAPERRQARIVGSSIRLDLNFLEAHLPMTYGHLHYQSVDVSALAWDLEAQGFDLPDRRDPSGEEPTDAHEALADIERSLQLLQDVREVQSQRVRRSYEQGLTARATRGVGTDGQR